MSYALTVTGRLSGVVQMFTETEKEMISTERAVQYIEGIEPEKQVTQSGVGVSVSLYPVSHRPICRFVCLCHLSSPSRLSNLSVCLRPSVAVAVTIGSSF